MDTTARRASVGYQPQASTALPQIQLPSIQNISISREQAAGNRVNNKDAQSVRSLANSARGSLANLLNASARGADNYQGFTVLTSSKKLHDRAEGIGESPMKMRSYSTLSHAPNEAGPYQQGPPIAKNASILGLHNRTMSVNGVKDLQSSISAYGLGDKGDASPAPLTENVGGLINFRSKQEPKFGIEGYRLPYTVNDKVKGPTWQNSARELKRFTDYYSESRKWIPPPTSYDVTGEKHHSTKKYKIYQIERHTLEEVKQDIKRNIPPPGSYNPKPLMPKIIGPYKSVTPQGQFICEAEFRGQETLPPNIYNPKYSQVEERVAKVMNLKKQSSGAKSFTEIGRSKTSLSPGQYNPEKGFDCIIPDYKKSCIKIMPPSKHFMNFVDVAAKLKKGVPPPGAYDNLDKVQDKIYKGASPRYKRGI